MKTYKTYQECKIENPECEVYVSMNGDFADENYVSYASMCGTGAGWNKCSPSDHCLTVKEFLDAGYRFVEGDLIFSTTCSDRVVLVTSEKTDRATYSVSMANSDSPSDSERYVLRAASLEWLKRADDADREALSRIGAQLSTVHFSKKPRTKVEFVKVEDSIWHLETDFKCGELFAFDGVRDYVQIETEGDFTLSHSSDNLYRRIESPMTEREAFIEDYKDLMNSDDSMTVGDWAGVVFDKLVN